MAILIDNPQRARQLARAIASDIKLYNEAKLSAGDACTQEIEEGRALFTTRTVPGFAEIYDEAILTICNRPILSTPIPAEPTVVAVDAVSEPVMRAEPAPAPVMFEHPPVERPSPFEHPPVERPSPFEHPPVERRSPFEHPPVERRSPFEHAPRSQSQGTSLPGERRNDWMTIVILLVLVGGAVAFFLLRH